MTVDAPGAGQGASPLSMDMPQLLEPEDVDWLHLDYHPRLGPEEAIRILSEHPGNSFWIPLTSEFILVTPWRHRSEIVTVHTLGAFSNEDVLLQATMRHAREQGKAGFVMVDIHETRRPTFYSRHGLERLEDIVTYEHRKPHVLAAEPIEGDLRFLPVDGTSPDLLDAVLQLDNSAFSWFWWNNRAEFDAYIADSAVNVWAGVQGNKVVAYTGTTRYRRWGHLDRIATSPEAQGNGVGRAMLTHAVRDLVKNGARRVALSTQGNNERSRTLYRRTGFERTSADDYYIFVAPFDEARIRDGIRPLNSHVYRPGDET